MYFAMVFPPVQVLAFFKFRIAGIYSLPSLLLKMYRFDILNCGGSVHFLSFCDWRGAGLPRGVRPDNPETGEEGLGMDSSVYCTCKFVYFFLVPSVASKYRSVVLLSIYAFMHSRLSAISAIPALYRSRK